MSASSSGPNIVFVVTDTTRSDSLGLDFATGTTAGFDAAAEGRVYRRATSPSPWTPPAHASMFTGLAPSEHGIWGPNLLDDHGWPRPGVIRGPLLDRWLPSVLAGRGYHTLGISSNAWVSDYLGFDHGFDQFLSIRDNPSGRTGRSRTAQLARRLPEPIMRPLRVGRVAAHIRQRGQDWGADKAVSALGEFLATSPKPFFAFLNFMEPHWPYHPPADFEGFSADEARQAIDVLVRYRSPLSVDGNGRLSTRTLPPQDVAMLRRLYLGEVDYLEGRLHELLDRLEDAGRLDDTVVVIVADHGEHLGEHGLIGHVASVHEELLHVPMLVLGPGDLVGRGIEETRVSTQNLYRAVLDLTRGERAILNEPSPAVTEYEGAWHHAGSIRRMRRATADRVSKAAIWAIYDHDWKLVVSPDGTEQLYELGRDPLEEAPVSGDEHRELLRRRLSEILADRVPCLLSATPGSGSRDARIEGELRALGYL